MTFLSSSIDWFLGKKSSHMGPYQYVDHAGQRDGQSTSGAMLWAACEDKTLSAHGNMVNAETNLLRKVAETIDDYVPLHTTLVELGPGTPTAFKNKTLPLIHKLQTTNCVLVDESMAFLKQIIASDHLGKTLRIKSLVDDFFESEDNYFDDCALVCSFGSTISNFLGPISHEVPTSVLVNGLTRMAQAARNGWMLVAFDSDYDGKNLKSFYKGQQELFQMNIFDRMAAELSIEGDFDPKAFDYDPEWIPSSGQLAHIALVTRDMNFKMKGLPISLKKGQKLHLKNSYKYTPAFFEECCSKAGLEIVTSWSDESPSKIYLLTLPPKKDLLTSRAAAA